MNVTSVSLSILSFLAEHYKGTLEYIRTAMHLLGARYILPGSYIIYNINSKKKNNID